MINNLDDLLRVVALGGSVVLLLALLVVSRPPRPAGALVRCSVGAPAVFMLIYGVSGSAGLSTALSAALLIASIFLVALVA